MEDLRERLWILSDDCKEEAEKERHAIVENRWLEKHMAITANLFIQAIQLEMDRYSATKQILATYANGSLELVSHCAEDDGVMV